MKQHHPYLLQKVANAAMLAVNSRAKFIKSYCDEQTRTQGKEVTEDEGYKQIAEMGKLAQLVADKLLFTCKNYRFDELP